MTSKARPHQLRAGIVAQTALAGRPLPPRPGSAPASPDGWGWQAQSSCRSVDANDSRALVDATHQGDAAELIDRHCARCPVVLDCLTAGRATRAWGVWGGTVLADGQIATRRPSIEAREASVLADRIAVLLAGCGNAWRGTTHELRTALATVPGEPTSREGSPAWLGRAIGDAEPELEARGVVAGRDRQRRVHLRRDPASAQLAS